MGLGGRAKGEGPEREKGVNPEKMGPERRGPEGWSQNFAFFPLSRHNFSFFLHSLRSFPVEFKPELVSSTNLGDPSPRPPLQTPPKFHEGKKARNFALSILRGPTLQDNFPWKPHPLDPQFSRFGPPHFGAPPLGHFSLGSRPGLNRSRRQVKRAKRKRFGHGLSLPIFGLKRWPSTFGRLQQLFGHIFRAHCHQQTQRCCCYRGCVHGLVRVVRVIRARCP